MLSPIAIFLSLVAVLCVGSFISRKGRSSHRLPPGPWGLPVLGHLHMLGDLPHRSLQKLALKYGPVMYIRLGLVPTVVVSSPEWARLFLKTHDLVFASRPSIEASKYLSYGRKGMVFAPYGSYWRNIRKVCNLQLMTTSKVELFKPMRRQEVAHFIESIKTAAESRSEIDLTTKVGSVVENMMYRMIFGFKDDSFNLKSSFQKVVMFAGVFNLADYIPWIGALDIQGLRRRMKNLSKVVDEFLEKIINEHLSEAASLQGQHRDFIDIMLSLIETGNTKTEHLGRDNIKAIMLDMLAAGMDSTTTAIDWTIVELVRHPRVMKLLQEELENIVGLDRMVEETDLAKLKYLKMVVKESMRLHSVGPLLYYESTDDITINGLYIPKKSRVIVNTWAIGRDVNVWPKTAEEFYPERFTGTTIDVLGRDFELLPFGSGRRVCPGVQLAMAAVELIVAQLVHCFSLELPGGMSLNDIDLSENFGLTVSRVNHLTAVPSYRLRN